MGSGGGDSGKEIRKLERERQARINRSYDLINQIFNGTASNIGANRMAEIPAGYSGPLYSALGKEFTQQNFHDDYGAWLAKLQTDTKQTLGGYTNSRYGKALQAWKAKVPAYLMWDDFLKAQAQEGNVYSSTKANKGYTDEFYTGAQNKFLETQGFDPTSNTWTPGGVYDQQARQAQGGLLSKYAGQGLFRSSAFDNASEAFQKAQVDAKRSITDSAMDFKNKMKQDVENQRNILIGQATDSASPNLSAQQTLSAVNSLTMPNSITPLTDLFSTWANVWLNQKTNQMNQQAMSKPYTSPYSNIGRGSMPVTMSVK